MPRKKKSDSTPTWEELMARLAVLDSKIAEGNESTPKLILSDMALTRPKSDKIRHVPIADDLYRSLQTYREAKVKEWFRRKAYDRNMLIRKQLWNETEHLPVPVFHNRDGKHLDADNILRRHHKRCLKKAGIRPRVVHDLRHTFASLHLNNGTPIAFISEWLGHSSIELKSLNTNICSRKGSMSESILFPA